jgi:hypothetical protein
MGPRYGESNKGTAAMISGGIGIFGKAIAHIGVKISLSMVPHDNRADVRTLKEPHMDEIGQRIEQMNLSFRDSHSTK